MLFARVIIRVRIVSLLVLLLILPSYALAASGTYNGMSAGPPIQSVTVVGGTHGNEYTGVWCIKELQQSTVYHQISSKYPSLKISTLMGNPEAHTANRRFLDTDLNREFHMDKLTAKAQLDPSMLSKEAQRAQELNQLLGPKSNPQTDVIVDLHTTTTNMGITLIIPERDALMAQAAAYVLHKCNEERQTKSNNGNDDCYGLAASDVTRIVMHSIPDRNHRPNLSSIARHGFTIEVGPVPQGVIRHDAVEKTRKALYSFLEFLELHNDQAKERDTVEHIRDWYPSGRVPCFRSAHARRPGEMSGKITWPCADDNENFPNYMIHQSIQDKDFTLLKTGDPLFVTLDGKVIPYSGSHGDSVYLMFINEGGYYYASSGTGIGVAVATEFDLETADFVDFAEAVVAEDDEENASLE